MICRCFWGLGLFIWGRQVHRNVGGGWQWPASPLGGPARAGRAGSSSVEAGNAVSRSGRSPGGPARVGNAGGSGLTGRSS
jgi:hypothetical protein